MPDTESYFLGSDLSEINRSLSGPRDRVLERGLLIKTTIVILAQFDERGRCGHQSIKPINYIRSGYVCRLSCGDIVSEN